MKPSGHRRGARRIATIAAVGVLAGLLAGETASVRAQVPGTPAAPTAEFVRNELIVRLQDGGSGAKVMELFARLGAIGLTSFDSLDGLYTFRLPEGLDVPSAELIAKQLDGVAYAEPNFIVTTGVQPNDPSFGSLWGLHNTGQSGGTNDADIDAPEAWDVTTGSADVVVAVIDTGTDYTHADLVANMFRNEADCNSNGLDDDGNGYADDCYGIDTHNGDSNPFDDHNPGHGTHTAGTIGAAGNNGVGVVGVNWQVKLMPCKFLSGTGTGSTTDAITCLAYIGAMKDRGVNIVATSNSWGCAGCFSQALYDAIEVQRQKGILFIAAAGNASSNTDVNENYPSNYDLPNVISVASTTRTDSQSSFSNYGRRTVHLGAPGSDILSTLPGNAYGTLSGTSMATPHVAGVAALLKAQDSSRDWRAIRNLLLSGGDNTAAMSGTTVTGKRLNALGSLTCSTATVSTRLKPIAAAITTTPGSGVTLSAINIACSKGGGNVLVTVSSGGSVTLVDDGAGQDQVAGDGIYSGSYVPATAGTRVLTFPDATTVTVEALSTTSYSVQSSTFGYRQIVGTSLGLADDTSAAITPPFPINFGGTTFTTLYVSSNGTVNLTSANNAWVNATLPTSTASTLIAPFWDDLVAGASAGANVFWASTGSAPSRELVIEWRNVTGYNPLSIGPCPSTDAVTFQVVFFEGSSNVLFNYADTTFGGSCSSRDRGASATVGVQTSTSVARQHAYNQASISNGAALLWTLPGSPGTTFTDDPLTVGATTVRAVHISELRSRIDTQRARFGLGMMAWTDPALVAGVTTVRTLHLLELRTALSDAYQAAGAAAPSFSQVIQAGVSVITAAHIAELRTAVASLEAR